MTANPRTWTPSALKRLAVFGLAAFVAALSAGGLMSPFDGGPADPGAAQAAGNTDQVLVKFRSNASQHAIDALNASMAVQQVDAIPALGIRVVRVPAGWSPEQVVARYAHNPLVEFAEVDALVGPEIIPSDPYYGSAWHLAKIEAPAAWDAAKANGVLIAVCDTGVASVPDLTPVLRGDLGYNTVDNSNDWSPIAGHGTLVSGAAAAATDNGVGVAGAGWGAQVIPVRISNQTGGSAYVSDAAQCIQYAADMGARVANLSYRMAGYSTIDSAAAYGQSKGMVTVVAAGNDGADPGWASYDGFLAVAATMSTDQRPSWSNYGDYVDLSAPGTSIQTTKWDGSYGGASGTSLSAPLVTGVLALVFGANPALTAADAEGILLETADDIGAAGWDQYYGEGRINADKAVAAALGGGGGPGPTATPAASVPAPTATPSPPSTATAMATPAPSQTPSPADTEPPTVALTSPAASLNVKGNVTISASASDNVAVTQVAFYVDGALVGSDSSVPYAAKWNAGKAPKGNHTIVGVAYDAAGNAASDSIIVTVR